MMGARFCRRFWEASRDTMERPNSTRYLCRAGHCRRVPGTHSDAPLRRQRRAYHAPCSIWGLHRCAVSDCPSQLVSASAMILISYAHDATRLNPQIRLILLVAAAVAVQGCCSGCIQPVFVMDLFFCVSGALFADPICSSCD
jgi:hypothetical protein